MKKTETKQVFGYTEIGSTSASALTNNYQNVFELKRELQGKEISVKTIEAAMRKVEFGQYRQRVSVHSFYPDKGVAYVGIGGAAAVYIKWDVQALRDEEIINLLKEISEKLGK